MSTGSSSDSRLTKNERREAAREKAKELREAQRKKDRRNRVFLFGGLGIVVVAILAAVTLIIVNAVKPAGPGPLNMASDGITISQGLVAVETPALAAGKAPADRKLSEDVIDIVVYVDYLCPFCGQFDRANSEQLTELIESGAAQVTVHPLAILDRASLGTRYSTRAANAASCVANYSPDNFWAMNELLMMNQPEENSEGLDNDKLKGLAKEAGASKLNQINSCIDDTQFRNWISESTARALQKPIPNSDLEKLTGTPTILVNGSQYQGGLDNPDEFKNFILIATGEGTAGSTSTSTPTPTPTPAK